MRRDWLIRFARRPWLVRFAAAPRLWWRAYRMHALVGGRESASRAVEDDPYWLRRRLGSFSSTAVVRLFVFTFPVAFVIWSWLIGSGLPYYLDNNETYLVYVEARNLEIWDPSEYGWLAATATDPALPHAEHVYTHMPNGPRYLHYLLLRVGIRDLPQQTLILGLFATILTVLPLWRVFGQPGLLVVPLAIVLDYPGFLAWTVNTYRVWTFVLYFGMVLAVTRRRPFWVASLAFAAFQADVGVALFVCASATALALLTAGRHSRWLIVALVVGTTLSAAIFGAQVLTYYGWHGLAAELAATYTRRGTANAPPTTITYLAHAVGGLFLLFSGVAGGMYNRVVGLILITGVVAAPVLLMRGRLTGPRRFLAILSVSTTFGAMVTSTLLYGYFVDAFVMSELPFATLPIALATGFVALELRRLLDGRWPWKGLGVICGTSALLPLIAASVATYRPPVAGDLIRLLATDYRGKSIVGPGITAEFAFALTGGRAASIGGLGSSAGFPVIPADQGYLDSMSDPDGTLLFLCLEPMYPRHVTNPLFAACQDILIGMVHRMRDTVASGEGWILVRFDPKEGPVPHAQHS